MSDNYDENLRGRISRWLYGCDHEFQETGVTVEEQRGPKLNFEDELVVEKITYKQKRCVICRETERGLPHDITEVKVCEQQE